MKKILIIIGVIVALLILTAAVYFAFFAPSPNSVKNTFPVPTNKGQQILVKDFSNQIQGKTQSSEILDETNDYSILYFTADKSFLITLKSLPLKNARLKAEQSLLAKLNLNQTDICQLKISVNVPNSIDSGWAGNELGLSFCPNAATLP